MTLESLSLNATRLSEILNRLSKIIPGLKKEPFRVGFARALRNAIWSWIDHYPMEFVSLCKSGTRLPGDPDVIFEAIDGWANSTVKKASFWPIQMDLLILSPDIFIQAAIGHSEKKKAKKNFASKVKFLDSLEKGIENTKVADAVAICFVDICKASTFIPKETQSGVRHVIPLFEHELKERLFNPQKSDQSLNNRAIVVDCLLSFYRLSHRKVIKSLFSDCLKPEYPPIFRLVLVECLLRMIQEGTPFLWTPSITDVYQGFSGPLRSLFKKLSLEYSSMKDSFSGQGSSSAGLGGSSISLGHSLSHGIGGLGHGIGQLGHARENVRKTDAALLTAQIQTETLLKLLLLFKEDPMLALHPSSLPANSIADLLKFFECLCKCATDFSIDSLASLASQALVKLHDPPNIRLWEFEGSSLIENFRRVSSKVNTILASALLENRDLKPSESIGIILLIQEILKRRNDFLASYGGELSSQSLEVIRSNGLKDLESALLVYLCSSQVKVISMCANCFRLLCREEEIIDITLEKAPFNTLLMNLDIYSQLHDRVVREHTSPKAQQKNLWVLLRKIHTPSVATQRAWDEVYERWCSLTQILLSSEEELTTRSGADSTLVLAMSRGKKEKEVKEVKEIKDKDNWEVIQEWSNFTGFIAALSGLSIDVERQIRVLNRGRFAISSGPVNVAEAFLEQLLQLVAFEENVNIREGVKLVLGTAQSPITYSMLFGQLLVEIRKSFGAAGQVKISEYSTLFVDQTISIVKLILESDTSSPEDLSHISDLEDLLQGIIKFVGRLDVASSLNMKTRLCGLVEAMMTRRNYFNIRNEFQLRNELMEVIMEWTSDFNKGTLSDPALASKVKSLDLGCLRALASLVKGLPLAGDDGRQKSNTFSRFFSFFTRLLTRCKKEPGTAAPELASVTVECLSNMVSENIEHGLQYFVAMGYHEDIETRPAFLNVLTNILKQGAKLDSDEVQGSKYEKLVDLLLEPELRLISALNTSCQITEADELSFVLLRFFEYHDRVMMLLRSALEAEIKMTDSSSTLFRRNSLATKMLVHFSRDNGKQYIKDTISTILRSLLSVTDSFEVDPAKLGIDDEKEAQKIAEGNLIKLRALSQQFLDAILDSIPNCPPPICDICRILTDSVQKKFPGYEQTAVCGFIFLRFFCPAIVAPEGIGLVQGNFSRNARRGLLLVTKTLQNLANRIQFGTKEEYMIPMNDFIEKNLGKIEILCLKLAEKGSGEGSGSVSSAQQSPQEAEEDLHEIHRYLDRKFEAINKVLRFLPTPEGQKSLYDRFQTVMQQLGNPPEVSNEQKPRQSQPVSALKTKKDAFFSNFMKRFEGNAGLLEDFAKRNVFYQNGRTKDAHPIFYYVPNRFNNSIGADSLLFYALKILQPVFETPWHLVIDCTLCGPSHEVSVDVCILFDKVIPLRVRTNLQRVYMINANGWVKKYSKRVLNRYLSQSFCKKLLFTTVRELGELVKDPALPQMTVAAESDVKSSFNQVIQVGAQLRKREITLLLGNSYLQLISSKHHHLLGHETPLVEIIPIAHIFECDIIEENVFYLKSSLQSSEFRTPHARHIVDQVKAAKERLRGNMKDVRQGQETVRPTDVRGALLNMSLLNLGSDNIAVREAAYNLLAVISVNFNFTIRTRMFEANGMYIPRYSAHFVAELSQDLASSHKELTLEFLLESLRALRKETDNNIRTMCLNYISSWIPNLVEFCRPPDRTKTSMILNNLVVVTVENPVIAPSILAKEWALIGGFPDLLDFVVEGVLSYRPHDEKTREQLSLLQDIVMAAATRFPKLLFGKLVSHLVLMLQETYLIPTTELPSHEQWPCICLVIRLILPLSFDNIECVRQYLPELFFVILLVFGLGSEDFRGNVHELFVNVLHSLYTYLLKGNEPVEGKKEEEEKMGEDGMWVHKMPQILSQVNQLNFRLYFGVSSVQRSAKQCGLSVMKTASFGHAETVALAMLEVLQVTSPRRSAVGTAAHCRLLSLISSTAFTPNSALQSRAMVGLGVFCCSPKLITEDIFGGVLFTLKRSLQRFSSSEEYDDVPTSILMCISRMYGYLPSESIYFKPLFWVTISLLQINNEKLLLPALNLLEVILKTLEDRGCFQEGVSNYLLSVRGLLEPELSHLDQVTGISFASNFSFATSCHLLQGFRTASAKSTTVRVLSTLVDLTAKITVGPELLAYLAALLPVKGNEMSIQQLLLPAADDPSPYSLLFTEQMIPDASHAALLFSFLTSMLKSSDTEYEQLFIYECIREGVRVAPEAFPVVYNTLVSRLNHALETSQNKQILSVVLKIMEAMYAWEPPASEKLDEFYLHKIGFQGLSEMNQVFSDRSGEKKKEEEVRRKENIARLSGRLLDRLIEFKSPADKGLMNRTRSQPLPRELAFSSRSQKEEK